MFIFSWIRKWREQRQLIRETEAREAERRIQRKKRDDQQSQALLLALYELQRTMDPLISAQVYNNRFCPLTRLPEELLLCTMDFLCDDAVALQCLRVVTRTFYRLSNLPAMFLRRLWYLPYPISSRCENHHHQDYLRWKYRRLLQRDGRCDNCRRWNDAHEHQYFDDCQFQQNHRRLHCYVCNSLHDVCQFSTYQQSVYQPKRLCLGQQGSVQLCEHIQITWASIKSHIDNWRQQQGGRGDWQACLNSFKIECHDNSHDTRCTASEAPTCPRARLGTGTGRYGSSIAVLIIEWIPHSRIDALPLTADGRMPAPELRALFQRLRSLGPADMLCPSYLSGALPEMALFSPLSPVRRFVYYKTGEDEIGPGPASSPPLPSNPWLPWHHGYHIKRGKNGTKLDIRLHYPSDARGTNISSQCLVVSYRKDIMICEMTALTDPAIKIIPTDHWLHALDPRTYSHPQANHIRPLCKDLACANYYLRQKDHYAYSTWPHADKRPGMGPNEFHSILGHLHVLPLDGFLTASHHSKFMLATLAGPPEASLRDLPHASQPLVAGHSTRP
ncbi:hypothetical protein P171DRAFT_457879 [Karstenula rhodostoma CBS 690.94]|uniref:F-box domain-containing protein n=1 Tax=Karstenula rhodostoma CBS 690.94 TaxID=1392251 RepID=A0A9P4P9X3_9PLEO|nr:hypothetical protein P171DRAFT_457879 [Karstenula rhodostoma CBS 690.94]